MICHDCKLQSNEWILHKIAVKSGISDCNTPIISKNLTLRQPFLNVRFSIFPRVKIGDFQRVESEVLCFISAGRDFVGTKSDIRTYNQYIDRIVSILIMKELRPLFISDHIISRKYLCTVRSSFNSGWNAAARIFLYLAATAFPSTTESISQFLFSLIYGALMNVIGIVFPPNVLLV